MVGSKICSLLSSENEGLNGYQVSVREDEKVLESDGGGICTTVLTYLMSVNCVFKNGKCCVHFTTIKDYEGLIERVCKSRKKLYNGP